VVVNGVGVLGGYGMTVERGGSSGRTGMGFVMFDANCTYVQHCLLS